MKRRTRIVALAILLAVLLAVPAVVYAYLTTTARSAAPPQPSAGPIRASGAPRFLFSFSGSRLDPIMRPVGVLADESGVYVVDSARHVIDVFDEDGEFRMSFGASETVVPLYIARSPLDGRLYVSDRRQGHLLVFDTDGDYIGPFEPRLPSREATDRPSAIEWAPVALDFASDGSLFVTDVLDVHRVLKLAPAGVLLRSVGSTTTVEGPGAAPGFFGFPNGISVHDGRVYVADSNNGRIQVFDQELEFTGMTPTGGLPRGIDFLPARGSSADDYVLIDALSNDATIRSVDDDRIVQFANSGDSRLSYPNGVSIMESSGRIYIADTAAGRVQVWGWERGAGDAGTGEFSWPLMILLILLPLLPLLLVRRIRILATPDFVHALIDAGRADLLGRRSFRWLVPVSDYGALVNEHPELAAWTRPAQHSQPDADALSAESGLPDAQAATLVAARRADVLATDQDDLRERASARDVQTIGSQEFMDRFAADVAQDGPVG